MTDLIERLREHGESDYGGLPYVGDKELMNDAIAEIEKLRSAIASPVTVTNFGARSNDYLDGFEAGVRSKEDGIKRIMGNEQYPESK